MHKIVFFEVEQQDKENILRKYPHAKICEEPLSSKNVDQFLDADIISCMVYSTCSKETLEKIANLQLICTRSVGFDHIDIDYCKKKSITVCNVPDYGSHVIAEHVFALLLSELRHIHEADRRVASGHFDYEGLRGIALKGKTIGILGTGKIGRAVAHIAHGFGMKLLATDMCRTIQLENELGVQYIDLDDLLAKSDIISIHMPATNETKHMINKDAFFKMKNGVILVNTARGSLINSDDLLSALQTNKVAYALLDVLENEKDFHSNKELIEHPNTVVTPHIGFYADDSMNNMYTDCFASIDQFTENSPLQHEVRPLQIVCDLPPLSANSK